MAVTSDAESTPAHDPGDPLVANRRWCQFRMSTLIVVMAVIALVLTVWANLVVPARHAVNASLCHSNLFKLYHALSLYDFVNGSLPPAYVNGPDGSAAHSWRVLILLHLESWAIDGDAIHQDYDFSERWNGPNNRSLATPVAENRAKRSCSSYWMT